MDLVALPRSELFHKDRPAIISSCLVDSRSWTIVEGRVAFLPNVSHQTNMVGDRSYLNFDRITEGETIRVNNGSELR
jgi:hypothetical protein